ncbi:GNAT family N-acetyltransferase [Streptomyces sp. NBC_01005]|uniref:GNAT family N-acetyltransferase n=1 Tax=unclassified Streptomyces TaxID=2593676 RepID=UPI002E37E02B|nr:GNAT family N-acetyltransferase [Streptomyces sp. NBC_01362]WSW09905.1 GNAT family N-acetyltransferase [Streptomyces sp. NBC_01005]WTC99414.1 GNAT family N-acetyltransferase [Streptomyces sp. NBC_01650]
MRPRAANGTDVRQATEDDITELVRLRAMLFENLGGDFFAPASGGADWLDALATVLKEQLTTSADTGSGTVRVLVVDGENGLAACGIGTIEQRLPGPHLRNGRIGQVIGVVTDPRSRRRGHSRRIMQELLGWFRESDVARVDLYASAEGEPLYRDLGFTNHPDPSLYWRP